MNGLALSGDLFAMNDKHSLGASSDKSVHRYDLARGWAVDGFALLTAAIVAARYEPNGFLVVLVVFAAVYVATRVVGEVFWRSSLTWLYLLTGLIVISTLVHALGTMQLLPALLLTLFLPGIAQAYLIWELWPATSSLLHPIPFLCLAWLITLAIWVCEPGNFRRLTTIRQVTVDKRHRP